MDHDGITQPAMDPAVVADLGRIHVIEAIVCIVQHRPSPGRGVVRWAKKIETRRVGRREKIERLTILPLPSDKAAALSIQVTGSIVGAIERGGRVGRPAATFAVDAGCK